MPAKLSCRGYFVAGLVGLCAQFSPAQLSGVPRPAAGRPAAAPTVVKPTPAEPPPGTILQPGELPIDLGTALRLAGAENPELMLARERVTEAVALRQLAAAQLLPNVNVGTNYDLHRGALQQSTGNVLNVHRDALYYGLGANAVAAGTVNVPGLNYNLNVGDVYFGILQGRLLVTQRGLAARAAENDVLLRVCLAYTDLLRADGGRAVAVRNRAEAAEVARLTAAYAQAQQGRKADADRALVELKKRDAELTQAEADILVATARLCRVTNLDPSTRLKPVDGWVVPVAVVPDPVPLADLIAVALLERPELAERRVEIRRALVALSGAKWLPFSPTVILGFSSGGFGAGSDLVSTPPGYVSSDGSRVVAPRFGDFGGRSDFDLVVFWTFRNLGVGNLALVREADSLARQARYREQETLNRVRAEVAEVQARTLARFAQIESAEKATRASGDAYTEDLARIKAFEGRPIELVDSLRLLSRSRYEYLDAIIDYNRAQFELYVALGRPPAAALARPVPAELVPPPAIPGVPLPGQGLTPGSAPPGPRSLAPPRLPALSAPVDRLGP